MGDKISWQDFFVTLWQLKRGGTLIFSIFWYSFWPKIPKTPKSLKNCFYLIKSHQDQVFGAKNWPKGPDFEFGHFTVVKSWKFSNFPKINFFWSERLQNWSKRSAGLKFLDKMLKSAKFWDFWRFLADLAVFDHIW